MIAFMFRHIVVVVWAAVLTGAAIVSEWLNRVF